MRRTTLLLLSLSILGACSGKDEPQLIEREGEPLVASFSDDDAQMNAAMETARNTLAQFDERITNPPATQSGIALKVKFEEGEHVEHMWLDEVELSGDGYRGTIANEPVNLKEHVLGKSVTIRRDDVSDWMAIDDGVLVGGYTLRVHRNQLPADQRAEFDAGMGFRIED